MIEMGILETVTTVFRHFFKYTKGAYNVHTFTSENMTGLCSS